MVRFRASAGKSNKTVSTSWSFTGDRWFESISLQRRVIQNPVPELPKGLRPDAGGVGPLRAGRITLEEALQRYQLTEEEYRSGERALDQHGLPRLAQHAPS